MGITLIDPHHHKVPINFTYKVSNNILFPLHFHTISSQVFSVFFVGSQNITNWESGIRFQQIHNSVCLFVGHGEFVVSKIIFGEITGVNSRENQF